MYTYFIYKNNGSGERSILQTSGQRFQYVLIFGGLGDRVHQGPEQSGVATNCDIADIIGGEGVSMCTLSVEHVHASS